MRAERGMKLYDALTAAEELGCAIERDLGEIRIGGTTTKKNRTVRNAVRVTFPSGMKRVLTLHKAAAPLSLLTPLLQLQRKKESGATTTKPFDRELLALPSVERAARPNYTSASVGFGARMETVSPQTAKEWLAVTDANGDHNRDLNSSRVDALAREIREGRWDSENGQTLSLSPDGSVMDGQHRCWAIIFAEMSVKCLVVRGVPKTSFATIDTGMPRSGGTILALAQEKNASRLAATARLLLRVKQGGTLTSGIRPFGRHETTTPSELLRVVRANPGIAASVTIAHGVNRSPCVFPDSALAAAHFIFHQIDPVAADAFFTGLVPRFATPGVPARTREAFNNMKLRGVRVEAEVALAMFFKAWTVHRKGGTYQLLGWKPQQELFPLLADADRVVIA